ncbi:all trans-polyprenyl-diphosphate synthase PDSS2-like [Saccoglossus kowalevskii]
MMKNKNTLHKYNKNGQVDFRMLHKDITSSESLEKTKALCHEYGQKALQAIDSFPVTDARNALQNIIRAVAVR